MVLGFLILAACVGLGVAAGGAWAVVTVRSRRGISLFLWGVLAVIGISVIGAAIIACGGARLTGSRLVLPLEVLFGLGTVATVISYLVAVP